MVKFMLFIFTRVNNIKRLKLKKKKKQARKDDNLDQDGRSGQIRDIIWSWNLEDLWIDWTGKEEDR